MTTINAETAEIAEPTDCKRNHVNTKKKNTSSNNNFFFGLSWLRGQARTKPAWTPRLQMQARKHYDRLRAQRALR